MRALWPCRSILTVYTIFSIRSICHIAYCNLIRSAHRSISIPSLKAIDRFSRDIPRIYDNIFPYCKLYAILYPNDREQIRHIRSRIPHIRRQRRRPFPVLKHDPVIRRDRTGIDLILPDQLIHLIQKGCIHLRFQLMEIIKRRLIPRRVRETPDLLRHPRLQIQRRYKLLIRYHHRIPQLRVKKAVHLITHLRHTNLLKLRKRLAIQHIHIRRIIRPALQDIPVIRLKIRWETFHRLHRTDTPVPRHRPVFHPSVRVKLRLIKRRDSKVIRPHRQDRRIQPLDVRRLPDPLHIHPIPERHIPPVLTDPLILPVMLPVHIHHKPLQRIIIRKHRHKLRLSAKHIRKRKDPRKNRRSPRPFITDRLILHLIHPQLQRMLRVKDIQILLKTHSLRRLIFPRVLIQQLKHHRIRNNLHHILRLHHLHDIKIIIPAPIPERQLIPLCKILGIPMPGRSLKTISTGRALPIGMQLIPIIMQRIRRSIIQKRTDLIISIQYRYPYILHYKNASLILAVTTGGGLQNPE